MRSPCVLVAAIAAGVGCAAAPPSAGAQTPPAERGGEASPLLVPPGFGTLRQDEVTPALRSGALLVKVTPLDERVIRLLAPDTYERLRALAQSRRVEASRATGDVLEMFLVSFFSYQPDVTFQPEDLQLHHQGRILRAAAILPVTGGFGRQRLQQQENQSAIYVFDQTIDYAQPFIVRYGFEQSDEWIRVLPKLEIERAKVRSRTTR